MQNSNSSLASGMTTNAWTLGNVHTSDSGVELANNGNGYDGERKEESKGEATKIAILPGNSSSECQSLKNNGIPGEVGIEKEGKVGGGNQKKGFCAFLYQGCPIWLYPLLFFVLLLNFLFIFPGMVIYGVDMKDPKITVLGSAFETRYSTTTKGELDSHLISTVLLENANNFDITLDVEYTHLFEKGSNHVITQNPGTSVVIPANGEIIDKPAFVTLNILQDPFNREILKKSTTGGLVEMAAYSKAEAIVKVYGFLPMRKKVSVDCDLILYFDPEGKEINSDLDPFTFSDCKLTIY